MTTEPKHPFLHRYNFFFLLGGLLILLLANPIARDLHEQWADTYIDLAFAATLILGVWSLVESRRWFFTGLALVAAGIVCNIIAVSTGSEAFILATLAVLLVFSILGVPKPLAVALSFYVDFVRATPFLVQLFIRYALQ